MPIVDPNIHAFILEHTRESDVQRRLREATRSIPQSQMQISPDEGQFLALLVRLTGARLAVEVGTYTGYSALSIAAALPPDGKLYCCDISEEYTRVGKPFWREAGVAGRIELRLAPASDTLRDLLREHGAGAFDFMFIDADKPGYGDYYETGLELVRQGGLIVLDNMLWEGKVLDPQIQDANTAAIRDLNRRIHADQRVETALLSVRDGVLLARKR